MQHRSNSLAQNAIYYPQIDELLDSIATKLITSKSSDPTNAVNNLLGYYEKRAQAMQEFIQQKKSPVLQRLADTPKLQRVQVLEDQDDSNSLISRLLNGAEESRREKPPSRRFQLLG